MKRYEEHSVVSYDAPIEVLPLFVRAGAFIPQAMGKMENVGDYNPNSLDILYFYSDKASEYTLFDDDMQSTGTLADGKHRLIRFKASPSASAIDINISCEGTYSGAAATKDYRLVLPGMKSKPRKVTVNGAAVKAQFDKQSGKLVIPVKLEGKAAISIVK